MIISRVMPGGWAAASIVIPKLTSPIKNVLVRMNAVLCNGLLLPVTIVADAERAMQASAWPGVAALRAGDPFRALQHGGLRSQDAEKTPLNRQLA
jgi:hypothetical protein